MAAYYVGTIRVTDACAWEIYVSQVGATISQYGGRVLFRGTRHDEANAGGFGDDWRIVTLHFDSREAAKRWHGSPEYQRLVPLRDAGAEVELLLYQG